MIPAYSQPSSGATVSAGSESCSPRSVSRVCPMTRPSTAAATSYTAEDPAVSALAAPPPRVTLSELQPTSMTADALPRELATACFAGPLMTAADPLADGSGRTSYGPTQISAQVLTLPRSIINCRNLSRPLTLCYAGRQVIVPPSCIVLSAEGAKLLLPPQTVVPTKPLPDPIDLSSDNVDSISAAPKTSGSVPISPPKSGPASETALSEGLMPLSAECKEEKTVGESPVATMPVMEEAQPTVEARCSAESAGDQQVLPAEDPESAADRCRRTDISKLNDHSLVNIFQFLRLTDLLTASHVCSRWNAVVRDPSLVNCTACPKKTSTFLFWKNSVKN